MRKIEGGREILVGSFFVPGTTSDPFEGGLLMNMAGRVAVETFRELYEADLRNQQGGPVPEVTEFPVIRGDNPQPLRRVIQTFSRIAHFIRP